MSPSDQLDITSTIELTNTDKLRRKIKRWAFIAPTIAIICILAGSVFLYRSMIQADRHVRLSLRNKAGVVAELIDAATIRQLQGDKTDTSIREYQLLKSKLTTITQLIPIHRYTYIMGYRNEQVFFYMDNIAKGDDDYSYPGQVYPDASDDLKRVFTEGITIVEGPIADEWGTFVSAIAPIIDDNTGEVVAAFGIDIDDKTWQRLVLERVMIPASILMILIVGSVILASGIGIQIMPYKRYTE